MDPAQPVFEIGVIVVSALVLVLALRRLRVPGIVAYILAGLLLGPLFGVIEVTYGLELFAELGIALLLFLVGLELSLDKIKDVGKVAVLAGIGQVVFTAAGGFALTWVLGFAVLEAVFIAIALTFSSTVVVVKLLDDKDELDSLYGRIAVGIFLVQDLVVIIALTFIAGLAAGEELTLAGAGANLALAFGGMTLLLAVALLGARYVLPLPFRWISSSGEAHFIWSLSWCLLFVLAAEHMALSVEIGAFLAGISLAQLPTSQDLQRRVHPLVTFFIVIFFVTLGIQMDLSAALEHWGAAIVLSLFVLIGNPFIFMVIISRMGYTERTSFLTSVTVAQISEFSFIFAAMGLGAGLIGETILSLIAVVGIVTIGISAYMILYNEQLYRFTRRIGLLRIFRAVPPDPEAEKAPDQLTDHVIVVGMNTLGRNLVKQLSERGEKVVAVDTDAKKLDGLPGIQAIGDASQETLLHDAKLASAKLLVSALNIERTNELLAFYAERAGVPSSINAIDRVGAENLAELGVKGIIRPKQEGTKRLLEELKRRGV